MKALDLDKITEIYIENILTYSKNYQTKEDIIKELDGFISPNLIHNKISELIHINKIQKNINGELMMLNSVLENKLIDKNEDQLLINAKKELREKIMEVAPPDYPRDAIEVMVRNRFK